MSKLLTSYLWVGKFKIIESISTIELSMFGCLLPNNSTRDLFFHPFGYKNCTDNGTQKVRAKVKQIA